MCFLLAVAAVRHLQMFVFPITYNWQMVWTEIKGPCNQIEGGQLRLTISQTIRCHVC